MFVEVVDYKIGNERLNRQEVIVEDEKPEGQEIVLKYFAQ